MNSENCKTCKQRCNCCANQDIDYECNHCGPNDDRFEKCIEIEHCVLTDNKRKQSTPVVLIDGRNSEKEQIRKALEMFLHDHGGLRL